MMVSIVWQSGIVDLGVKYPGADGGGLIGEEVALV
jgi:hypothetical protein